MNDEIKVAGTHADCPGQTGQDTHGTPASWKHSVPGHPVPFPALAPTLRCSHHTSRDVSPLAWSLQWLGLSSLVAPPLAWLAPPRARFLLWCGPFLRSYSQPERVVPRGSASGLWSSGSITQFVSTRTWNVFSPLCKRITISLYYTDWEGWDSITGV